MKFNELLARFETEDACKEFLVARRWPDGVTCPRCGNVKVWEVKSRPFHWLCKGCNKNGYRFSVITKTIFENTKYPLREWFKVAFLMYHSKKGMSAHQIHRMLGTGSYETAWYMCHRIRVAMRNSAKGQLFGDIGAIPISSMSSWRVAEVVALGSASANQTPGKLEGEEPVPPKPKPHDKEVVRRVEKARPGAKATEPTFETIIDAILDANPEAVREHKEKRRQKRSP